MKPDFLNAAIRAAETLIKFDVKTAPVSPLPILKKCDNVLLLSFADMADASGVCRSDLIPLFGKNRDAVTSIYPENGGPRYVVAYDAMLPFGTIQRALARELGHIVLGHTECSAENTAESLCFAHHLLCPRALIHSIEAISIRITEDFLASLTGVLSQSIAEMRRLPGVDVPAGLNRFVRSQFMPFVLNLFDYYQRARPKDGSALVDLGSFMENYKE